MGALVSGAVAGLRCPEEANVRAPESVLSLHLNFIRAGAELIETNTFGANRRKLAEHYLEDELAAINESGVKLARDAREVSGAEVFVAGSIGPLGGPVKDREAMFAEQAGLLEGREPLGVAVTRARRAAKDAGAADDLTWAGYVFHGDPRLLLGARA